MLKLSLEDIVEHIKKKHPNVEIQKETEQAFFTTKIGEQDFPFFIRIHEGSNLLQMLAFIPCAMKKEAVGDLARILHILNKEVDFPGFGMDETASVVFYRCMLPAVNKKVDPQLVDLYLQTIENVCKMFANSIQAVAFGAIKVDDILKKTQEAQQQQNK